MARRFNCDWNMENISILLKENIKKAVKDLYDIDIDEVPLEHPENEKFGDYSTSIGLILSKKIGKIPFDIAEDISKIIKSYDIGFVFDDEKFPIFKKIETLQPGFINFKLSDYWLKMELSEIFGKGESYGSSNYGEGKIVIIEFSQPNPNKPMHIGHSRNNFLGSSLSEIFSFSGFNVIKMNYMNDWGTHICKSMLMYKKYGEGKDPDKKSDHFVGYFYKMYEEEHEKNPETVEKELAEMFSKMESGDEETLELWKKITSWAYDGWKPTYENENVSFDVWEYQSNYTRSGKDIVEMAIMKGIAEKDPTGAVIAKLEKYGIPDKVLLRSDGSSIYITQDTQFVKDNYEKYNFEKRIYVVDRRQSDYFKQLFKLLELLGFSWVSKLFHLSYGWVSMPDGGMSSRVGNIVDADGVFEQIVELEKEEIKSSLKEVSKLEDTSKKVALSAYRYGILKVDPKQDIVFNFDKLVSFEGNTGPYLMYSYARAMSILEKAGFFKGSNEITFENYKDTELKEKEINILRILYKFPDVVAMSAEKLTPHIIANYLYDVAQRFNSFYNDVPVLDSKGDVKDFRISLVVCTSQIIKNGLGLLGIDVVDRM